MSYTRSSVVLFVAVVVGCVMYAHAGETPHASFRGASTPRLMVSTNAHLPTILDDRFKTPGNPGKSLSQSLIHPPVGSPADDVPVVLHLVLVHDTALDDEFDAKFWAANTPGSPDEGKFLDKSHVAQYMAPRPESTVAVLKWLAGEGVTEDQVTVSPFGDHMFVDTTAGIVTRLLKQPLLAFEHTANDPVLTGRLILTTQSHELGKDHPMAEHVGVVRVAGTIGEGEEVSGPPQEDEGLPDDVPHPAGVFDDDDIFNDDDLPTYSYPFTFWPPPPVLGSAVLPDGKVLFQVLLTCSTWAEKTYPFTSSSEVPDLDTPMNPCSTSRVDKVIVTLSGADGNDSHTVDASSCQPANFQVKYYWFGDYLETSTVEMALCEFEYYPITPLVDDHGYTVEVELTMELSASDQRKYQGYPEPVDLHIMQTPLKTPSYVHKFYGVPQDPVACNTTNVQAIGVLQPSYSGYYSQSDLEQFYSKVNIPTAEVNLVQFVGSVNASANATLTSYLNTNGWATQPVSNNPSSPGGETSLDVQWISGTAPGALTHVFHGGYFVNPLTDVEMDAMLAVIIAVQYADPMPLVLSMSYGGSENYGALYEHTERSFKAMGLMGISIMASSGDQGAFVPAGATSPNANVICANPAVNYPASSPYVTGVGATQMRDVPGNTNPSEVVCGIESGALITSGGGFSAIYSMPDYQRVALNNYSTTVPVNAGLTNMRGVPDVSLYGHNYLVIIGGKLTPVDGTSCSSPTFAALVTLWNDARLHQGLPPLGFLNPRLYSLHQYNPKLFNDITVGNNKCVGGTGGNAICCTKGYSAVTGWDPVTGLGSPSFLDMGDALLTKNDVEGTWVGGNCTVESRSAAFCAEHGDLCVSDDSSSLPKWALGVIIAGAVAIAACCCVGCYMSARQRKRYAAPVPNIQPSYAVGNGNYTTLGSQPQPQPQQQVQTTNYGVPSSGMAGAVGGYAQPPANAYAQAPTNTYGQPAGAYGQPAGSYPQPQAPPPYGQPPTASYPQVQQSGGYQPAYSGAQPGAYGAPTGASTYGQPSGSYYPPQ